MRQHFRPRIARSLEDDRKSPMIMRPHVGLQSAGHGFPNAIVVRFNPPTLAGCHYANELVRKQFVQRTRLEFRSKFSGAPGRVGVDRPRGHGHCLQQSPWNIFECAAARARRTVSSVSASAAAPVLKNWTNS